jgi:hypothetical protein
MHLTAARAIVSRSGLAARHGRQALRWSGVPGATGLVPYHQHPRAGEVPIAGGRKTSGIVRRGDRLLRPMGPWPPAVHEYLHYLEAAGFAGSPRVLGTEGDREVLAFLEGDVAVDPLWRPGHGHRLPPYARTDLALRRAAKLIRKLHSAAAGFRPAITSYRFDPRPPRPGEVVSHGDLGPWNTVYRDGIPVAFIDWDSAGPVDPLADLAAAARAFVPLAPPEQLAEAGFDPLPDLLARLRTFVDAFGLAARKAILPELQQCMLDQPEQLRWLQDIATDLARAL